MKTSVNRWRATLAVAAGLLSLAGAGAFTFITNSRTNLPIKWPAGPVPLRIMLGSSQTLSDGSNFNTSAQAAAETWNARIGAVQFAPTLTTGSPTNGNGVNELAFAATVYGTAYDDNVLAVTTTFRGGGNTRAEGDTLFNTKYTWDSYRGSTRAGVVDLQRVAIHELGHTLGLDHPDQASPVQNVSAIMNSHVGALDTLADDDIQGVQALYGPPGVPANNNFANATVITLKNGSLAVNGYNTNATKETGEPNHAGNNGGRSVWWRWTPPVDGNATIDTKGSYYDTTLAVYTGSALNVLAPVASDDDIEDGVVQASTVTLAVTGGTTYQIAVDGFNNNDGDGADNGGIKLNLLYTPTSGAPPTIVTQPVGTAVNVGGSASFSVTASGSEPLSYQWMFNGAAITGATSASYTISSAQASDGGTYSVAVSNPIGSVTSNSVSLTVRTSTPTPTPTPTPSGGGGGGGGAPSPWFLGLLASLALGRWIHQRRR